MKKILKAGLVFALIATIGFAGERTYTLAKEKKEMEVSLAEARGEYPDLYNHIGSLTYSQFQKAVENKEDFYVYVGRPTCGDCNDFEPKFIDLITKYNLEDTILYLNVAELRKDETKWEAFKETYDVQYTPTLAKFSKGVVETKVEWTPEKGIHIDDVERFALKNIKEEKRTK